MRGVPGAVVAAALACLPLAGCGGSEEASRPSGAPMSEAPSPAARRENAAPLIERVRLDPSDPVPGVTLSAVVDASDPDGDPLRLRYEWRVNGELVAEGARPAVSLPDLRKDDEVEVRVVATDGVLESSPRSDRGRVVNRAPMVDGITFTPEDEVRPGDTIVASPSGQDPDNDRVEFRYTWLVNGVERGSGREFPTTGLRRGDRVAVRVVASDGRAESRPVTSPEFTLENSPPRITALPELETDSGVFRYAFEAVDDDGDRNLRFWLEQSPDGMTIDPILGVVTWRPGPDQAGAHPVEVGVKDGAGEGTTFLFEVTVTASGGGFGAKADAPPAAPAP